jgi:hypothetical protein
MWRSSVWAWYVDFVEDHGAYCAGDWSQSTQRLALKKGAGKLLEA